MYHSNWRLLRLLRYTNPRNTWTTRSTSRNCGHGRGATFQTNEPTPTSSQTNSRPTIVVLGKGDWRIWSRSNTSSTLLLLLLLLKLHGMHHLRLMLW